MIKAIIFDMDGVLADTEKARFEVIKTILKKRNIYLDSSYFHKMIGTKTKRFLKDNFGFSDEEINQIHKEKKDIVRKDPKIYAKSFQNVTETIKRLSDKYTLAVASSSSKETISLVLQGVGIYDNFPVICSCDDVHDEKPSPEIYKKTLEKLKLNKKECFVIEDSPSGIMAAKKAGLFCVGITNTRKNLKNPGIIIDNIAEINEKLIKSIEEKFQK